MRMGLLLTGGVDAILEGAWPLSHRINPNLTRARTNRIGEWPTDYNRLHMTRAARAKNRKIAASTELFPI
jgi:hypothetical protein